MADIFGTTGHDDIRGTRGNDRIDGLEGDDELRGRLGDDTLFGGAGDDELQGDEGDDVLFGGRGADKLKLDLGNDVAEGGDGADKYEIDVFDFGNDVITDFSVGDRIEVEFGVGLTVNDFVFTQVGADTQLTNALNSSVLTLLGVTASDLRIRGDAIVLVSAAGGMGGVMNTISGTDGIDDIEGTAASDLIDGLAGADEIRGRADDDVIDGGAGDDELKGDEGNDQLFGGAGADELDLDLGDDTLTGGEGADTFKVEGAVFGNDVITDFDVGDEIDFDEEGPVTIATVTISQDGSDALISTSINASTIRLLNVDASSLFIDDNEIRLSGMSGGVSGAANVITGTALIDDIEGTAASDHIFGLGGDDEVRGRFGNDTLEGGDGNDELKGDEGDDVLLGGNGADELDIDLGNDELTGGNGPDKFKIEVFNFGNNIITDFEIGDEIDFDEGGPVLLAGMSAAQDGADVMLTHTASGSTIRLLNVDVLDVVFDDNEIRLFPAGGSSVQGGAGDDRGRGGRGNDDIRGRGGNDDLSGHDGDDYVEGGSGDDLVSGGGGNDLLIGDGSAAADASAFLASLGL